MSITLTGWTEFERKTGEVPHKLLSEVDIEIEDAANEWRNRAINSAPADQGLLRNGITVLKEKKMEAEVQSRAEYSAWMEWGTRRNARVPAELAGYASTFRGMGGGSSAAIQAKAAIYRWAARKGIDKKRWWGIYIAIMTAGIKPHPFFFIHQQAIEIKLIEKLDTLVKTPR